ncbi:unnamed protein product [Durusdinium trenchii]|uniref:U-box domain-containing protein n=1 Tax=Durusdinium trenchii TaxID=1381693 RepID=A0ABP0MGK1_9DINO
MPLYVIEGMRFPAVHLRGQMSRLAHYGNEASDEDEFDFVDSSRSAQSDDYCMPPEAVESGSAGSPSPSRHSGLLPGFGLGSDLSEPDFLGGETDDDSDRETESDGEISNANNLEFEDEYTCDSEEALLPPQLPVVAEEKLQECWPLGDATFAIFICPITHDVMTDPVVSADGYTYERAAIARWFETSRKSPVTGQTLPHADLVPNQSVRTLLKTIIDMTEKHQEKSAQSHGKHRGSESVVKSENQLLIGFSILCACLRLAKMFRVLKQNCTNIEILQSLQDGFAFCNESWLQWFCVLRAALPLHPFRKLVWAWDLVGYDLNPGLGLSLVRCRQ